MVESTTRTHSSADWWDFYFPWHRHQIEGTDGFERLLRKTLAKRGKRNCPSSEEKFSAVGFEPDPHRPVASAIQRSNPLGPQSSSYCPSKIGFTGKNPTLQVQLAVRQLGLHNSFSECYQTRSHAGYDYMAMNQYEPIRCMAL